MNRPMTITYAADGRNNKYTSGIYAGEQKPMLRITNRFLIKSGFKVGSKINVQYGNKIIIITKKS